jgi:hypothetical protein
MRSSQVYVRSDWLLAHRANQYKADDSFAQLPGNAGAAAGSPADFSALVTRCTLYLMSQPEDAAIKEQIGRHGLPPASFEFLILSLRAQTEMQLGLFHFDDNEKPEPDFDLARHSIDMMNVLLDKTRGNLTVEEQRLLENTLTELRFRYIQVVEESKKPK